MYYLIFTMWLTTAASPLPVYSDSQIPIATKAECETRRDNLLKLWGVQGKAPGAMLPQYVPDAWCIEAEQFKRENHVPPYP